MGYFAEFRTGWRALLAAALGIGGGAALYAYSLSLFGPELIAEFGWSRGQFAIVGLISLLTLVCVPVAGRLADSFGVRRTAAVGVFGAPLCFLAFSFMGGGFSQFMGIALLHAALTSTTTSAVFSRLVAERFDRARGLALAIVVSGPAAVSAIGIPFLARLIDTAGWRAGYQGLAAFSLTLGLLALLAIPRPKASAAAAAPREKRRMRDDYALVAGRGAFWVIMIGMLLCNIAQALPASHMKILLMDKGASSMTAAMIISSYSTGVIFGRFACGLALDRLPAHIVAAVSMGLPALGLFLLASPLETTGALTIAVLLMGLSQGAEGDLAAYLVMRHFGLQVYSSTVGLVTAAIAGAAAIGSLLMGWTLEATDGFTLYLYICTAATFAGSLLFILLGRSAPSQPALAPRHA